MKGLLGFLVWNGVLYAAAQVPYPWNYATVFGWLALSVLVYSFFTCGDGNAAFARAQRQRDVEHTDRRQCHRRVASVRPIRRARSVDEPAPAPWPFVPRHEHENDDVEVE